MMTSTASAATGSRIRLQSMRRLADGVGLQRIQPGFQLAEVRRTGGGPGQGRGDVAGRVDRDEGVSTS